MKRKLVEVTDEMAKWASLLSIARAQVDAIRPIVRGYQQAILQAGNYLTPDGERITEQNRTWELRDEHATELYGLYEEAAKLAGFDLPQDVCPLLLAQYHVVKCETRLMQAALPELKNAGFRDIPSNPAHRKELVELLMGLVGVEKRFIKEGLLELAGQTFVTEHGVPLLIPRRRV